MCYCIATPLSNAAHNPLSPSSVYTHQTVQKDVIHRWVSQILTAAPAAGFSIWNQTRLKPPVYKALSPMTLRPGSIRDNVKGFSWLKKNPQLEPDTWPRNCLCNPKAFLLYFQLKISYTHSGWPDCPVPLTSCDGSLHTERGWERCGRDRQAKAFLSCLCAWSDKTGDWCILALWHRDRCCGFFF